MDGILSLSGMFGKNRFRSVMMPKRMRSEAPSFPMKCGVEKRGSTLRSPSPMRRYEAKMPAMYTPPICRILSRESCSPKRNAIVMRRIENEHGCTLSRSDDMRTSGRSHAPPSLAAQMREEGPGLNFRTSTARMNTVTVPPIMRIRFILRGYVRLYCVHERAAGVIGECHKAVYATDAGRAVCVRVVDDADSAVFAGRNGFVGGRDIPHARHAERSLGSTVRPHQKGGRTHAGSKDGLNGYSFSRRVGHGELFGDVAVLHRDRTEVDEERQR